VYVPPADGEAITVDTLAPIELCVKLVLSEIGLDETD
jgi:hypothetical protein